MTYLTYQMRYRIAGNFRGRKLSRIGRIGAFHGENVRGMLTGRIMGVACLEFRGENFRGWLKIAKFVKVSPSKVSHYTVKPTR